MTKHVEQVYSPSLYLDRDKRAIAQIEDRLLHQEPCAAVCMYGNGKDYLFANVVKRLQKASLQHTVMTLNTISADELRDFANSLAAESQPILCLVNLRIRQDVSWFIQMLNELRVKRQYAFVSFVCTYVGDVYQALRSAEKPLAHSLTILKRIPYEDALHMLAEQETRFGFVLSDAQKRDIYHWSYGHVGLLRTLYLLKRQAPDRQFSGHELAREPAVIERLQNILSDIPAELIEPLQQHNLAFIDKLFLEELGYIDHDGALFHPLLAELLPKAALRQSALSATELRVLEYLKTHAEAVVSREDIARIVWGEEEWQDKYSDWAIGQLIYRLRKKLESSQETGTIQTVKTRGFAFQPI